MAKISESQGRTDDNSGFIRLLGHQELGHLISKLQAAVIRTGIELEHILEEETPAELKTDLDTVKHYKGGMFAKELQIVFHITIRGEYGQPGHTGDIAVFDHKNKTVKVIEVKDGDTFDTKKSSGELETLELLANILSEKLGYRSSYYFCCFNQDSKEAIVKGAKNRFTVEHAMTGKELCENLHVEYNHILERRQCEQVENRKYFVDELMKISDVRKQILAILLDDKEITLDGGYITNK